MASYYKRIKGVDYDRAILEMAEACVQGQGDGRISLGDAKKIVKLIKDGGKITPVEQKSLLYILENYHFTDTAIKHIKAALTPGAAASRAKAVPVKKAAAKRATSAPEKQKVNQGGKKPVAQSSAAVKKAVPARKSSVQRKSPAAGVKAKAGAQDIQKKAAKEKAVPAEKKPAAGETGHVPELKVRSGAPEKKSMWELIIIAILVLLLMIGAYFLYVKYRNGARVTRAHESTIGPAEEL